MFDGLSGMDWLFIVAALALGFGVVKFMLVAKPGQKAAVPSVLLDAESTGVQQEVQVAPGPVLKDPQVSTEARSEEARPSWFELLDIPRTASAQEIEQAFQKQWLAFEPDRVTRLMADLGFIADGGLEAALPKQLELRSMKAAVAAQQLKVMVFNFVRDLEGARQEGLMRRRQGLMD